MLDFISERKIGIYCGVKNTENLHYPKKRATHREHGPDKKASTR